MPTRTPLSGENASFLEALYNIWLESPNDLPADWKTFFASGTTPADILGGDLPGNTVLWLKKQAAVTQLTDAFRRKGHLKAHLDPLSLSPLSAIPELTLAGWGLGTEDLSAEFMVNVGRHTTMMSLRQLLSLLEQTYCGHIGYEFDHVDDADAKRWWLERIEHLSPQQESAEKSLHTLEKLIAAETLERYLHTRYVGQKRFSLEGAESAIAALDGVISHASRHGVEEMVMGMAHRGRLNVLVNIMGKDPALLFAEFEGRQPIGTGSGDVKYHMGYASKVATSTGIMHLSLAYNPSHLEIVNPVVQGQVRAQQQRRHRHGKDKVMALLIHGDSALGGLGVNQTTFNLSQTAGYGTGGTLHLVINNQVGFTTSNPHDMRSSHYCTDIAKMIGAPIIHVNSDDVDAVCQVIALACEWRMAFNRDIVIDLVCFRKLGHNESDEPRLTQPLMYQAVDNHPGVRARYGEKLIQRGLITNEQQNGMIERYRQWLSSCAITDANTAVETSPLRDDLWERFDNRCWHDAPNTSLPLKTLMSYADKVTTLPDEIVPHPTIQKQLALRQKMGSNEAPLDWGMAETLAYASLLDDGIGVRISGEDSGRGTFSHRHAVVHNQKPQQDDQRQYIPLQHISDSQADFQIIDSVLNEESILAYEYGYASSAPDQLVIWEAQFGDFANGAQIAIDQFISSSETKWDRYCGLTVILPHGYDGQGPEHSSGRLERWLQLCAENNMRVVMPSESAQMFHLLRGQMLSNMRKPLIIFMSKRLLRFKDAMSPLTALSEGAFRPVIADVRNPDAKDVTQVILCAGQVYYDVLQAREAQGLTDKVVLIRVEQLYPFPHQALKAAISPYQQVKNWLWLQEEPANQGAWRQIRHELDNLLPESMRFQYAGRPAAAAPATGYRAVHQQQIADFLAEAFHFVNV
ncbi:2-oxoglutarate dehydrogenase E1 component [Pectobacterium aroidearum]|uniref:2-oxoglutarate dehydrogenase E1 component n=1 Tax=Pectobacterium aroidearum TaxID=1201031 RepID=UPI002A7FAA0F|nr:2-oxoglutarate dehydrogenase E1 component [Pectobacterium aroidearum]MDY4385379.1 2-oxoglutarate dehydrogenase E1 component [Pectobacterium aroidearum]